LGTIILGSNTVWTLEEHTASTFSPDDGGSMFLLNIHIFLQVHMALDPRKPTLMGTTLFSKAAAAAADDDDDNDNNNYIFSTSP
jgi:hypothetical protein